MKSNKNFLLITFILPMIFLGLFTSCLPDNDVDTSRSEVRVFLDLKGINNTVAAGGDTLRIVFLKFIHGNSFFLHDGDTLYFKESPTIIIHGEETSDIETLVIGELREGSLGQVTFKIEQAPPTVQNIDPDFIQGDTLYSMIIEGLYQDSLFTFKSTANFSPSFNLSPPLEAESNSLFQVILNTDAGSWFLNEDGQTVINPRDTASVDSINQNIRDSFSLEEIERF